jgi:hypothetical protein
MKMEKTPETLDPIEHESRLAGWMHGPAFAGYIVTWHELLALAKDWTKIWLGLQEDYDREAAGFQTGYDKHCCTAQMYAERRLERIVELATTKQKYWGYGGGGEHDGERSACVDVLKAILEAEDEYWNLNTNFRSGDAQGRRRIFEAKHPGALTFEGTEDYLTTAKAEIALAIKLEQEAAAFRRNRGDTDVEAMGGFRQ